MNLPILIGAVVGFAVGRWSGLILGALIGYFLGGALRLTLFGKRLQRMQRQFLDSTFAVMGAVSKADGRVTADEIRVAETMFDRLHLSGAAREAAKAAFNRGKAPGFDVGAEVARFAQATRGQRVLHQMFIQMQLSALAADGQAHPDEHAMLVRIARGLGLSELEVQRIEALLRGAGQSAGQPGGASARGKLDDAYRVLGLTPTASTAEIKRAYRKLISQNHPDKLAARGLPESMRAMAEARTREITGAYELIERARAG